MSALMMFRLATMPGDPKRPNEDYVGALGNCAVLLDGSGSPGDLPSGCIHGVPWFVRQLASRCLLGMAAGDPGEPLEGILAAAIEAVMRLHRDTCDLTAPGTPSTMVVMARAGTETLDYLVLGDSTLIISTPDGITAVTDRRMEEVAPPEYRQMLSLPTGTPEHQSARIAFVRKQQPLRNAPGGYPVASTDPGAARKAITGNVPAQEVQLVAMASDGVTRFAEFGLGSWEDMLGILAMHGPGELFAHIRNAEDGDPQGQRWPRAKQHDDVGLIFWENDLSKVHTSPDDRLATVERRVDRQEQLLDEIKREVQDHARLLAWMRRILDDAGIALTDTDQRDEQAMLRSSPWAR